MDANKRIVAQGGSVGRPPDAAAVLERRQEKPAGRPLATRKWRPIEWLVEKAIFLISLSAILIIFLIFAFVGREALPVILGKTDNSRSRTPIAVEQIPSIPPGQLAKYLKVSLAELKSYDDATIRTLVELKAEELEQISNPDARLNTTSWGMMLKPYQWQGYDKPEFIWQPVGEVPKYNLVPLIIGSLKATLVALLFSVPLGVGAAIYVSQLAPSKLREFIKPVVELLSGVPSVVLGFFALIVMASWLQAVFGYQTRLNALVAGIALGFAVVPIVFTISEDAMTSVPKSYAHGALALGASQWQVAWQVVLPAALPGVFAACVLGFGRAIGETMIVLMASGNATVVSASIFDSCRTMTATIAAELAEVVFGGHHYRVLFLIGALLFAVTFVSNLAGDVIVHRLKLKLGGKTT